MFKKPTISEFADFIHKYSEALDPPHDYINYLLYLDKIDQLIVDGLERLKNHPVNQWLNSFPSFMYTYEEFKKCKRKIDEVKVPSLLINEHSIEVWEIKTLWLFTYKVSLYLGRYFSMKMKGGVTLPNKAKRVQALKTTKKLIRLLDEGIVYLEFDMERPVRPGLVKLISAIEKNDTQGFGRSNDGFSERRWLVARLSEFFDLYDFSSKTKFITKIVEIMDQDITDAKVYQYLNDG